MYYNKPSYNHHPESAVIKISLHLLGPALFPISCNNVTLLLKLRNREKTSLISPSLETDSDFLSWVFQQYAFAIYFSAAVILYSVLVGESLGQFLHVTIPDLLAEQERAMNGM